MNLTKETIELMKSAQSEANIQKAFAQPGSPVEGLQTYDLTAPSQKFDQTQKSIEHWMSTFKLIRWRSMVGGWLTVSNPVD